MPTFGLPLFDLERRRAGVPPIRAGLQFVRAGLTRSCLHLLPAMIAKLGGSKAVTPADQQHRAVPGLSVMLIPLQTHIDSAHVR